jgi:hypothetical protein
MEGLLAVLALPEEDREVLARPLSERLGLTSRDDLLAPRP